jgi:hypothetical protein
MLTEWLVFAGFFGCLFVLRIVVATIVFFWILPEGDRCPLCDSPTLRVSHGFWNRLTPWLRTSWCYECGWSGLLRHGELTPVASASRDGSDYSAPAHSDSHSGQFPPRSK